MARVFIDGFESGEHDMWDAESNAIVISSAGKDMDGDYCLDLNASSEYLEKDITADDEMYFAFLYRPSSDANSILSLRKDATNIFEIYRSGTAGDVTKVTVGGGAIETGTKVLVANTTYLVEIRFKMADSGGRIVTKFDSVTDIDYTGDTKPGADTQFNKVRLGYCTYNPYAYFDNFIMDDTTWVGDTKIQKILPTGAGTTTGWTPSAGNNWACVDERPPSDVDYVSINANDTTDTYAAANMAGSIGSVKCVQVQSRTESDGTPTPTNLKLVVRSGAADYLSANKSVPTTPEGLWNLWETNPADSAAWEEADVNAMEIGIKSAA